MGLLLLLASVASPTMAQTPAQNENDSENPAASSEAGIPYDVVIEGANSSVTALLKRLSILIRDQGKIPRSYGMLYARIEQDLKAFDRALRSEGYYDSHITRQIDSTKDKARITLRIFPGPRYMVESVDLAFIGEQPDEAIQDQLRTFVRLDSSKPARAADIVDAEDRIMLALPQLGYPLARTLDRRVVIDHDSDTARITYRINAGPAIEFGPVRFTGANRVKENYLNRLVPWESGDPYDQSLVEQFRRTLIATRLFGSVRIGFAEDVAIMREASGTIAPELLFDLTEASQRSISLGAGYSTGEGFGAGVTWEHDNLFGAQERLTVTLTAAEIRQALTADLRKPNFRRRDQALILGVGVVRDDTDAFESLELGGRAGIERVIGRFWNFGATIEAGFTDVREGDERRTFLLWAMPLSAAFDNRDDLLNPTEGIYVRAAVTPHLAEQSGFFSFYKSEIAASTYHALDNNDDIVLAARVAFGSIQGAKTARLPASRRFYAGGGGSVRGFGFQNVGPFDEFGDPAGGRSLFEGSFEARFKLSSTIGIVPFVDVGEVTDDKLPRFDSLRWGAGLGFRYYTSFAPIRIDLATPINRRPGESRIQFYISIGQNF